MAKTGGSWIEIHCAEVNSRNALDLSAGHPATDTTRRRARSPREIARIFGIVTDACISIHLSVSGMSSRPQCFLPSVAKIQRSRTITKEQRTDTLPWRSRPWYSKIQQIRGRLLWFLWEFGGKERSFLRLSECADAEDMLSNLASMTLTLRRIKKRSSASKKMARSHCPLARVERVGGLSIIRRVASLHGRPNNIYKKHTAKRPSPHILHPSLSTQDHFLIATESTGVYVCCFYFYCFF